LRISIAAAYNLVLLLGLGALGLHQVTLGARPLLGFGLLLCSVLVSLGAGDNLYFLSMQKIGLTRAMPISQSYPLIATTLAVTLLGEPVTPGLLVGIVLIPAGLYLVTVPSRGRVVGPRADPAATRV